MLTRRCVEEFGLAPNEVDVLAFLSNGKEDTAGDICRVQGHSKSLVCRSVEGLTRKGYLVQRTDEVDRRVVHLLLTEEAKLVTDRIQAQKAAFRRTLYDGIPEQETAVFFRVLNQMAENAMKE